MSFPLSSLSFDWKETKDVEMIAAIDKKLWLQIDIDMICWQIQSLFLDDQLISKKHNFWLPKNH